MTEPGQLHDDVRTFLDGLEASPRPVFTDELIAFIRTLPPEAMALGDLPVGELGEIRNVVMPGPGGGIALRLFDPRPTRGPGPVVVFYHGGGFVVGSIESHAGIAAEVARHLDLPVVSVEYRMAPEHPWPAPHDDAEAAARWIAANGAAFDREFTDVVLCGDSAGATLALVTALALRDRPADVPVRCVVALYPRPDSSRRYPSDDAFADGYALESANVAYFIASLKADVNSWRASPALADQAGLPPMLIATAEFDPLRDGGRAYAAQVAAAGGEVHFLEMKGTIHGFASYRASIESARADLARVLDAAAAMIARG